MIQRASAVRRPVLRCGIRPCQRVVPSASRSGRRVGAAASRFVGFGCRSRGRLLARRRRPSSSASLRAAALSAVGSSAAAAVGARPSRAPPASVCVRADPAGRALRSIGGDPGLWRRHDRPLAAASVFAAPARARSDAATRFAQPGFSPRRPTPPRLRATASCFRASPLRPRATRTSARRARRSASRRTRDGPGA